MRRSSPPRLLVALAALAVAIAGCTSSDDGEVVDFGDAAPGDDAPALPADSGLSVADAPSPSEGAPPDGGRLVPGGWAEAAAFIEREAEAGRPTLVNIFASWCGPCRSEMPLLTDAWQDNPEIAFLGIDHMDRLSDGERFVDEFSVDFTTLHDPEGDVAYAVGARGMPTTVVFDRDGNLAARKFGEVLSAAELEELLDVVR